MPDHSTKAIFLDLSGVLYDGDRVIPGALDCVSRLRKLGFTLRFVTNTATKSAGDVRAKLQEMGFELSENELFTAPDAARAYLVAQKLRPFALVHEAIRPLFDDLPQEDPNCVVLGDARDAQIGRAHV
jgi:ribonucleotide monophosphatase NagD (HAD superfamily)